MPELAELEAYRSAARRALGRPITTVRVADAAYLKAGLSARRLGEATRGRSFERVSRLGKFLLLLAGPHEVAIHLGMAGHLSSTGPTRPTQGSLGLWCRTHGTG